MTEPQRARLGAAQAALLRALLADGPAPPGFDVGRLRVEAEALLAKRRRVTALIRPDLADALDDRFTSLFDEYAQSHPRQDGTRARADAAEFAAWLVSLGVIAAPRRRWWRRRD